MSSTLTTISDGIKEGTQTFAEDARVAMEASPGYFTTWYTVKSIALVGAIATAAYYLGKSRGTMAAVKAAKGRGE
jgi:hypothetical protein